METRETRLSPKNGHAEEMWQEMFFRPRQIIPDMQKKYLQGQFSRGIRGLHKIPTIQKQEHG